MTIQDTDITFVVQGPVSRKAGAETVDTVASIRRLFPRSPIVLSTWEGADCTGIVVDHLINSPDPGPIRYETDGLTMTNNVNRQIVSTRAGLATVQTPYAAKLRSDAEVTGRGFTALAASFPARLEASRVFEQRIVLSKQFTRSPRSFVPMAYHPSDLFQFGLTRDLRSYWDADLLIGDALDQSMLDQPPAVWFRMFDRFRYTTEQYLFLSVLNRMGFTPHLNHYAEIDDRIIADSEQFLFNNFIPCDPDALGVDHQRFRQRAQKSLAEDCLGLREFIAWYLEEPVGLRSKALVGTAAPHMTLMLRAERVAREMLKRNPLMRRIYAGRFLKR